MAAPIGTGPRNRTAGSLTGRRRQPLAARNCCEVLIMERARRTMLISWGASRPRWAPTLARSSRESFPIQNAIRSSRRASSRPAGWACPASDLHLIWSQRSDWLHDGMLIKCIIIIIISGRPPARCQPTKVKLDSWASSGPRGSSGLRLAGNNMAPIGLQSRAN